MNRHPVFSASGVGRRTALVRDAATGTGQDHTPAATPAGGPPIRRREGARFATAALLLLALGVGSVALGPDGPGRSTVLAAAVASDGTPAPGVVAEETLLEVALPAEALPHGDAVGGGLVHFTIAAGSRATREPYCCPGLLVEYVLSDAYTVRAEAAIRVVRADGAVEEVPAGTEVVLGPGDGPVSGHESAVEMANTGDAPVELLSWILIDDSEGEFGGYDLAGWEVQSFDVQGPLTVPPGPATLRLRRVELAGDADFPVPAVGSQFVVLSSEHAAGTPAPRDVGRLEDGTFRNFGRGAVIVHVLNLEPAGGAAGTPVAGSPTP